MEPVEDAAPGAVQAIFSDLRARIVSGQLQPGSTLVEQEIAESLGVSRTPVREALRQLANLGLVDLEHRRRARVAIIGPRDIEEAFEVRGVLEPRAAGRAARHADAAAIDRIERAQGELDKLSRDWSDADMRSFVHWNAEFHLAVLDASANPWLIKALRPVVDLPIAPFSSLRGLSAAALDEALRHHHEILRAIRDRDAPLAEAVMRVHLLSTHRTAPQSPAGRILNIV